MNVTAVEVSFVATPANKRARILVLTDDDGIKRDFLSWRPVERNGAPAQTSAPATAAPEDIA
jgi:hypothetical protein